MSVPPITTDLAFRLLHAEAECCLSKLRALQAVDGNARGVEIARIGGTLLLAIQSRRLNPYYNRVLDLSPEDTDRLDEILDWMRARDVRYWLDLAPALIDAPHNPLLGRLAAAGLHPSFFLNVLFARPVDRPAPLPHGVAVDQINLNERGFDLALVMTEGLDIPEELIDATRRAAQIEHAASGWRIYLAAVDGQPAAYAAMYVHEGMASIDAMATRPCYRRLGCQSALLQRCLRDAAREGCEWVVSQTVPSSTSERNFNRGGFSIAYTKPLYSHT